MPAAPQEAARSGGDRAANPLLCAALRYYRPRVVLSILAEAGTPCALSSAAAVLPGPQVVTATADDLCDALAQATILAELERAFDVVHVDRPGCGTLGGLLPLVSVHGVLVADCPADAASLKEEAADLADGHDLIAICQFGKVALSSVDIVALLGLAGATSTADVACPPVYSPAFCEA